MAGFLQDHKFVLLFYLGVILLVYFFRKKFDMQGIIALYRTKIGLKQMESISTKYREYVKLFGYIGIGAAYIGLVIISVMLFKNLFDLFTVPDAQSAVSPVLPGIQIPGTQVKIPLFAGWLALFIVIVVHEFAHGVVARAHNLKIKSSGLFFLGPLMGAFVEPEEKELRAADDVKQYSVLAAGPFANMLLAALVVLFFVAAASPLQKLFVHEAGVVFDDVLDNYPAKISGIEKKMLVTKVNDKQVSDIKDFIKALEPVKPGDQVKILADDKEFTPTTVANPKNNKTAYLGITGSTKFEGNFMYGDILYWLLNILNNFLSLVGALSLGIGLINLFPIFITDGARMVQVSLLALNKKNSIKGMSLWKKVNVFCLAILLLGLFFPLIKWIGNLF
ncbi:site-2 protease family protein [Candidatus Woesearchaeota archaeon]|nr:site-2 protease family protein [Candidatus Woesearchaeota archaeon]